MIVVMRSDATETDIGRVVECIRGQGLSEHVSRGTERTIIGVVGDERVFDTKRLQCLNGVERAIRILADWRMISREVCSEDSVLTVRGRQVGGSGRIEVPLCALTEVPSAGGFAYADPYAESGTPYAPSAVKGAARTERDLAAWAERVQAGGGAAWVRIRDVRHLPAALAAGADVLCLDGCLMDNRAFLREAGCLNVPLVLFKDRHHTAEEWLSAAEYIVLQGNHHVILGDSGVPAGYGRTGFRLDVEAVAQAKRLSRLPVAADLLSLNHAYIDRERWRMLAWTAGADVVIG